jgi:hypothetical protein
MRAVVIPVALWLALGSVSAFSQASDRQSPLQMNDEQMQALYAKHEIVIDGKQTPEAVPLEVKMTFFFNRYLHSYREQLRDSISVEDDAALSRFAEMHSAMRARNVSDVEAQELSICSRAQSMDGVALASAFEEAAQNGAAARDRQYREWLNTLSPKGRRSVLQFVQKNIRQEHQADRDDSQSGRNRNGRTRRVQRKHIGALSSATSRW